MKEKRSFKTMIPDIFADNLTTDIDAALEDVCHRLPALEGAAKAFAELISERQSLDLDGTAWLDFEAFDGPAFGRGVPLLANQDLSGLQDSFLGAAERLLPVLERVFPNIGPDAFSLGAALVRQPGLTAACLELVLTGDMRGLQELSEETGASTAASTFLVLEIVKPCLRQAAKKLAHLADDKLWYKGYCPVCGGGPDLGFLKERRDPSEFIISKAGQLWFHCPLCGHIWRFVRLVCPSCGQTDHERLKVFTADGREKERIHACSDCRRYVPVIDLVEREEKLHPDLAALGVVHLDILAQEKGYAPLVQTPWNRFS
jgi:FdhE protein